MQQPPGLSNRVPLRKKFSMGYIAKQKQAFKALTIQKAARKRAGEARKARIKELEDLEGASKKEQEDLERATQNSLLGLVVKARQSSSSKAGTWRYFTQGPSAPKINSTRATSIMMPLTKKLLAPDKILLESWEVLETLVRRHKSTSEIKSTAWFLNQMSHDSIRPMSLDMIPSSRRPDGLSSTVYAKYRTSFRRFGSWEQG